MTRTFQASALVALAMLGFSLVPASAGVVFSESFESPVVTGFDDNTVPSGGNWIGATQGYGATNRGLYNETFAWPATAAFSTAYGSQAYYLNYSNSGLTTAVGATGQTLTAGVTYKVTFNSAVTVGTASGSYRVELVAFGAADSNTARANAQTLPGTILATATGTVTSTDMSAAGSLVFTPAVGNAHLGKDLGIRLIKSTNSVLYDNIRLVVGHDMNPSPASGVYLPAGNTVLSWTNMPPTLPASSTPVDVWFGTNPASLTLVVSGVISTTNVNAPVAGTYYWRVDSHLDGNPLGTPVTGDIFSFVVTDTDGDGLPDAYELAHTTPPSGTALNPTSDLDSDGLTAAQEYFYGTDPNNPDTDGDTLKDGDEIHGTAGLRPATNPLLADTDGDGLSDGVETNTGIWAGSTNTGTNPVDNDWDKDGIRDGAETNTGIFVDKNNTGTNPYNSDTDNDGVGDYYEVNASLTNPLNPNDKPKVPYPLPVPDGSTGVTNKPVRVYIMSGQSNMVGMGTVAGTATGSLETITRRQNKFPNLVDGTGAWRSRQDVRYRGVISAIGNGPLAPGFGASTDKIGPELGFGYIMGWYHDEPVLLLKSSIGNRSLGWDVLPPGSPSYQYGSNNYAGYGGGDQTWAIGSTPVPWATGGWYAGYEWDRYFTDESEWAHPHAAETNVVDVLDNFAAQYPAWAGQGFEIAGFVWWQGDKDRYDMGYATKYEPNLVNLINSLRNYYTNRYPGKVLTNAPFVLATLGQTAIGDTSSAADKAILDAQLAVDGNSGKYPQYAGNVKTVYAHPLSQGGASNSHYDLNAETYMLVGDALGRAMLDLEDAAAGPDVTPPSPNPMTFAIAPTTVNTTTVGMVATTAIDASGPVQYYFENTSNSTNSGWITSTRWDSTGLTNGVSQNFRVKARDSMGNETAFSAVFSATPGNDTIKPSPDPMTFASPLTVLGENSIAMTASTASDINGVQYQFVCTVGGGPTSAWQSSPDFTASGLNPATSYTYAVRAKDSVGNTTADSAPASATTAAPDSTPPAPSPMTFASAPVALGLDSITMTASTASDVSGVEYFFDCTTAGGHDSSWQNSPSYTDTGLSPGTQYTYRVQARDKSPAQNATAFSAAASATTKTPDLTPPSVLSLSPADNAIDVPVANNLVITFDEEISSDTGFITLKNLSDATETLIDINDGSQVTTTGSNLVINPTSNLLPGKNYAVRIDATALQDLAGNPFAGISDDTTWNFASAVVPFVWTQTAGGAQSWETGTNWLAGSFPVPVSGDTVDLSSANIVANTTLTLGADRTAQLWKFGDATTANFDWIVGAGNKMILAGTTPTINVVNRTATLNNVVDGSAGLVKTGGGTLALANTANTYTGGTTIEGGNLTITGDGSLGASGSTVTVNASCTLNVPNNIIFNRPFVLNNGASLAPTVANAVVTVNGAVTGTGSIAPYNQSNASLTLASTANTFTGNIQLANGIQQGTLIVNSIGDGGIVNLGTQIASGSNYGQANFRYGTGATAPLVLNTRQFRLGTAGGGKGVIQNDNTASSSANTITINTDLLAPFAGARTLELGGVNTGSNTFAGKIIDGSGTVSLSKGGNGNWMLSGANTYSGATVMGFYSPSGGNLIFQGLQSLPSGTALQQTHAGGVGGFGTFKLLDDSASPVSRSGVNINMLASNTNHTMTLFVGNNNTTNGGGSSGTTTGSTITLGNLNITQNAVGNTSQSLSVTGANSYRLQINNVTPTLQAAAGAYTVNLIPTSAPVTVTGNVQQAGNASSGTISLVLDGTAAGNLITGNLLDSADAAPKVLKLTKSNSSVWTLSGNNSFSGGLTLSGATAGSQLNLNSATAPGTGTFTISGGNNAKLDNTSGSPLTLSTNNAQTWSNDFAFVGSNDLNLGTGAVTMGATRNVTVTANTLTVGGAISGPAFNLTKSGNGTLVLGGANSYTGTTTVSAGKLFINGDQTAANGAVSVSANATLGGSGIIGGATTVAINGKLEFNLSTAFGSHDKLELATGKALTFAGASTLTITSTMGASTGDYILLTAPGGISGSAPATLVLPSGWAATVTKENSNTDLVLHVTSTGAVGAPEIAVEQPVSTNIASGGSQGFGTVTLGSNTSLTFTIRNSGNAVLNLTGTPLVAVSGTNAGDFSVTAVPTTPVAMSGGTTTFTVQFAPGGAGVRGAVLTIANNDSDEGTFTINVSGTGQTAYDAWSGGAAFDTDANGDGVKNGLAWLLGAANPNANALGKLPVASQSGGNLILTFQCLNAASRGAAVLNVQHSSDLGISDAWTSAAVPEASGGPVNGVSYTITPSGNLNNVTATIPLSEAVSGKLFSRLQGTP